MVYIDEFGVMHSYDNSFSALAGRLFSSWHGIALAVLPLILLIGGFFALKHYCKDERSLKWGYIIVSKMLYITYFCFLIQGMAME